MKEITEQQIVERANLIGNRPAFPVVFKELVMIEGDLLGGQLVIKEDIVYKKTEAMAYTGMTYRQWVLGQSLADGTGVLGAINNVDYLLYQLAKAELEAEQEESNE